MCEAIEKSLQKGELNAALRLMGMEFSESIDFNDELMRAKFNKLSELKTLYEEQYIELVCKGINENEVTRDPFSYVKRPNVRPDDLSNKVYFIEAFSQIALKKGNISSSDYEMFINILYAGRISNEAVLNNCDEDLNNNLEMLEVGDSFHTALSKNKECYFILGGDKNGNVDISAIMKALNNIVDFAYEESVEKVGIVLDLPAASTKDNLNKIYFQLVVTQLLLKIISCRCEEAKPIFTFLFNEENSYRSFEKTLLRLNKPEKDERTISKNRDERFQKFIKSCLTKDPVYIERLKSIFNIIDEEEVPILILGESGVGKSVLAQNIHRHSIRGNEEFEEQNCGGLSENHLDQRLFGWKKGSFTGAIKDTRGKIERADGGTLFLDEIDRMPKGVRNALLTFIDTQKYDIIGSEEPSVGDVRLLFGTNKNLKELLRKAQFEEDFYYRINRRIIEIPALRDRKCDIDLIAENVLASMSEKKDKYFSIEPEALNYLKTYSWPANVREFVTYIQNRCYDIKEDSVTMITLRQCEQAPFENLIISREDDYINLTESIRRLLDNWDIANGNFFEEVIGPILAKTYIDDCFKHIALTPKKEKSMGVIGISGRNYNKSTLQAFYDKFPEVKRKLGFE